MQTEIIKLHEQGLSYREIAEKLGKSKSLVAFYIRTKDSDWDSKRKAKEEKEKEFHNLVISIIKESNNYNQVCNKLNLRATNTNYDRLKKIVSTYNVDISHFNTLDTPVKVIKQYSIDEIFCENTNASKETVLKNLRMLREHKCDQCKRTHWEINENSYPIPLQMHHINGNRRDNRLDNLQLLCPNCHYFTDNFGSKNIKRSEKEEKICPICKKSFIPLYSTQIYCSINCNNHKMDKVSDVELNDLVKKYSISDIAKMFKVTPKTIRVWCKKYNIEWIITNQRFCSVCGKVINSSRNRSFCSEKCFETNQYNKFINNTKHIDLSNVTIAKPLTHWAKEFKVTRYDMYKYIIINNYKHLLTNKCDYLDYLENYIQHWRDLNII